MEWCPFKKFLIHAFSGFLRPDKDIRPLILISALFVW